MSVISRQCDELRGWADQLSEREGEFGVVVRAPVAAIRRAADTIIEMNGALLVASRDYGRLEAENAKLRELTKVLHAEFVRMVGLYEAAQRTVIDEYSYSISEDEAELADYCGACRHKFADRMRKLGIEVD